MWHNCGCVYNSKGKEARLDCIEIQLAMLKWRNIMENSLRASSATSHWFLAWIYCSKLWRILMAMVTSWSHCWAKPTVECSVYLLSRINFSSRIAPKSSFLRRLVQWHIQQHDEPKENNFILNCYTKMNLKWFLKWCLKIFLWQFV